MRRRVSRETHQCPVIELRLEHLGHCQLQMIQSAFQVRLIQLFFVALRPGLLPTLPSRIVQNIKSRPGLGRLG